MEKTISKQDILDLFEQFLIDNNCYSEFITNLLEQNNETFNEHVDRILKDTYYLIERELVNYAFTWNLTEQKFWFWNKLDEQWRRLLEKN